MMTYCMSQSSQYVSSEKMEKEIEWQNALKEAKKKVKEMFGEEYEPTRVVFGPDGDRFEVTSEMLKEGWIELHRQQNNSTKKVRKI